VTSETLTLLGAAFGGIFGAGVAWATMRARVNKTAGDVNGLGRKFGRSIAFQLRALAEDEPISKRKLMHLADLIDPR
jgi:hypothetical protein